jgi:hypothetical protein
VRPKSVNQKLGGKKDEESSSEKEESNEKEVKTQKN